MAGDLVPKVAKVANIVHGCTRQGVRHGGNQFIDFELSANGPNGRGDGVVFRKVAG